MHSFAWYEEVHRSCLMLCIQEVQNKIHISYSDYFVYGEIANTHVDSPLLAFLVMDRVDLNDSSILGIIDSSEQPKHI